MAMIPVGRSLLECAEMTDHFRAFDYMVSHLDHPFDEALLKVHDPRCGNETQRTDAFAAMPQT
jgi:hypothetical protein